MAMGFAEKIRLKAMQRSAFRCCVCHVPFVEVHHIIPQAVGGDDTIENAAPLCARCHDLYGGNPEKRKQIRQIRDWWWEEIQARFANLNNIQEIGQLIPTPEETGGEERLRSKPAIMYHVVFAEESFEDTVEVLCNLLQGTQKRFPGAPRYLFIDIEGHRTEKGAFDRDMWELQRHFILGAMGPYLTKIQMPLVSVEVPGIQRNDVPDMFQILPPNYSLGKAVENLEGKEIYWSDSDEWIRINRSKR